MSRHQLSWNPTTRAAVVQAYGDAPAAGGTVIGNWYHDDTPADADLEDDNVGHNGSHVVYHHVRDALYNIGVEDMARVAITFDDTYVAMISVSSLPATVTLAVGATQQITNTFNPVGASNQAVTYSTNNAAKATVSASGLITAVASGTATITVTTVDGAKTDTVVVTIS